MDTFYDRRYASESSSKIDESGDFKGNIESIREELERMAPRIKELMEAIPAEDWKRARNTWGKDEKKFSAHILLLKDVAAIISFYKKSKDVSGVSNPILAMAEQLMKLLSESISRQNRLAKIAEGDRTLSTERAFYVYVPRQPRKRGERPPEVGPCGVIRKSLTREDMEELRMRGIID